MKRFSHSITQSLLGVLGCSVALMPLARANGQPEGRPGALATEAKRVVAAAGSEIGVRGAASGWWFLRGELEHLAEGFFWEGDLEETTVTGADPVPVIARYAEELDALGVRLVLCPVPAKAAIYPEKLASELATDAGGPAFGTLAPLAPFIDKLVEAGVEVIDLEPVFRELRSSSEEALYCAQDSHWSPLACRLAAGILADLVRDEPYVDLAREAFEEEILCADGDALRIYGDLLSEKERQSESMEELAVSYVGTGSGRPPQPLEISPESPVLVVGDSHTLVFNEGADLGMHAHGAGLVDHLAAELGFPVDREASKGSGGDSARANVARRSRSEEDLWNKKKVVFWVFSAREFSRGKWRPIPANVD